MEFKEQGKSIITFLIGVMSTSLVYTYFMGRAGVQEIGFLGSGLIFGYWKSSMFWLPIQFMILLILVIYLAYKSME